MSTCSILLIPLEEILKELLTPVVLLSEWLIQQTGVGASTPGYASGKELERIDLGFGVWARAKPGELTGLEDKVLLELIDQGLVEQA